MDDLKLLDAYVQTGSESAFAQLVTRYSGMVYGVCLRQLRDPALAEDATQAVFLILASKAVELRAPRKNVVVGGWLFQTAKFAAGNAVKLEARRKRAERNAVTFKNEKLSDEKTRDALTAAILDETLQRLPADERNVLILRYYHGLELQDIGAELSISADAAEKRVARALERLKTLFFKEGFVCSVPAIAGVLAANAKFVPPAELATRLARDCALGFHAAGTGAAIAKGTLATMNGFKIKVAVVALTAAVLLAGSAGYVGYAAGRSRAPAQTAGDGREKAPEPVRVEARESVAGALFAARVEYERRYILNEIGARIADELKAERDRTIQMEKAGQVTRIDVSNAEIGYKTVQFEQMQGARCLAEAKAKLEELGGPKDEALTHVPAGLNANEDLETDEAKGVVTLVETKDGKVGRKRTVFKPEDLSDAQISAAVQAQPEAESAVLKKRLASLMSELKLREAALLLEAQRAHFAILSAQGTQISFERGLTTSAELQHAISEKLKAEGEYVNKRADYLLQLGAIYALLGRDPATIKIEEAAPPEPKPGEPNF